MIFMLQYPERPHWVQILYFDFFLNARIVLKTLPCFLFFYFADNDAVPG